MSHRMMPTFEPVAMRSIVLNRANKLAANSNFYIDGFEAHKMGNLVQAIFETIESQLPQAYEAGLRDAVPQGWKPIETAPKTPDDILLRAYNGNMANGFWGAECNKGKGAWVWPYVRSEPSYWMSLPAAPKGEKE